MKINWTDNAIQDLKEIKAYISRDSDFYATRFIEKLIDGVGSLSTFPEKWVEEFQRLKVN